MIGKQVYCNTDYWFGKNIFALSETFTLYDLPFVIICVCKYNVQPQFSAQKLHLKIL